MKIVHVVSAYLPESTGGTQMQLRDLAHAQRAAGHEVQIFTRIGGDEFEEFSLSAREWEGVPVTRLTHNFLDCDRFEKLYTHPVIDQRFRTYLEEVRPDLVHIHHLTCLSTSMVEVAKEFNLPLVMWLSDYWLQCPRGQRILPKDLSICDPLDRHRCLPCLQNLWPHHLGTPVPTDEPVDPEHPSLEKLAQWDAHMHRMIGLCDALLTPSAFHRDRFLETGFSAERFHVVTYGLPKEELLAPPRGARPIRRVGYIGTVIPSKGVHVLIEAFRRLGRADLVLDIYGEIVPFHEKTDYLKELEEMIDPAFPVHFHGRYENRDLPKIFEAIDLLVVPSLWWESFCLTAREGAVAGLPVVTSDLAGLAEAVDEGLVLGFDPEDPEDLTRVIARVCDEPELRDSLTRKAHLVRDMWACAEEIEGIYGAVTGEETPRSAAVRGASKPLVSLVIPTWNAGPEFPEILERMLDQELPGELEVIAIDSGSKDGTVEFLRSQPVRLLEIPNHEFNHGLTRNLGVQEARGEIVALATQDARPLNGQWLKHLVDCYEDPQVAGAYSCQIPRPDANPFIKERLSNWVAAQTEPRRQSIESRAGFESLDPLEKLERVAFDNVSSSVRRRIALELPFRQRQFGEDLDWGHRVVRAGFALVFEPRSKVVHSHNNSIWYEFKRVYLDHQNLQRLFGVRTVPRWQDALTCTRLGARHLMEVVERDEELSSLGKLWWKAKALPFSLGQNLGQYLGARSADYLGSDHRGHRWLDAVLRRGV